MSFSSALTATDILAAATRALEEGGYRRIEHQFGDSLPSDTVRLFEDAYNVVCVVVYETWSALVSSWADAQAALVELMSQVVTSGEPKAWDGYLALLTPGEISGPEHRELTRIRYNTSRLRKLVATGED